MTTNELADKYLEYHGLKMKKGDNRVVLIPYLMMDAQYQIYCQEIRGLTARRMMKLYRNRWIENYNHFYKDFTRIYSVDEYDSITDLMDGFEEHITNAVEIAKVQVMNLLPRENFEKQKILSCFMLCDILVQSALILWRDIYGNKAMAEGATYMDNARHNIFKCMNEYFGEKYDVHCNESVPLQQAVQILCNKMTKYIYL